MSNVTTLDRQSLKAVVRPALDRKLKELSDELGIQITSGSASFDPNGQNATFKVDLAVVDQQTGAVMTQERQDFLTYAKLYDLSEDMLDQAVVLGGDRLRIVGFKRKARKNNIVVEATDGSGRQFVAPAATVLAAYQRTNASAGAA